MAETFARILVICTRQLGDVLLTTPLIREAKRLWPAARIDVLGFQGTLKLLQGSPDVHELVEVPEGSGWRQSWPLIRRLWRRYDLALIAQYTDRAHLYGFVAAPVRSGQVPDDAKSRFKRRLLRHAALLGAGHSHVVIEKLRLLDPWRRDDAPVQVVPPPGGTLPADLLERLAGRYVVIQSPSLVRYKQWPVSHYAEVARRLAERGLVVMLTGSPSAQDRGIVAEVAREAAHSRVVDIAGRLDLAQTATLLAGAAAYLGPDTSVTHLAAACGTPTVAVYGPIDPRLWGPWPQGWPREQPYVPHAERQPRRNVILLQGSPDCVPCNRQGCENHPGSVSLCLETMSAQRVLDALDDAMTTPTRGA